MKKFLVKLVIESDSKLGKRFDIFIQILIVLSIISFSIETLPELNKDVLIILDLFELITVILFSIELILRLFLTSPPFKYLFSFYGLIDILAILPFYLTTGFDLRTVRVFRLFRIFKLFKYSTAIDRLVEAFSEIKKELLLFLIGTLFFIYLSSIGIYYFEKELKLMIKK